MEAQNTQNTPPEIPTTATASLIHSTKSTLRLLLTSNGLSDPSLEKAFLEMTNYRTDLKIAWIGTAGDPIEWVPDEAHKESCVAKLIPEKLAQQEEWWNRYREKWEARGYRVINADLKEDPAILKAKLQSVDVIDVGGGDVNYLLDWAKKSQLDSYLKDLLDSGVVYMWGSAGSMLVNPDIGFTWWDPDKWATTDHTGLWVVDFMFQPLHWESDESTVQALTERKAHLQSLLDYPWKIFLVKDGQAIKVDGDTIEHIGAGVKNSI